MIEKRKKKGFTLIELLVVISIIGILASLILARYSTAEKTARDAQRKSDLNQYRIALENYAAVNDGVYPSRTAAAGQLAAVYPCENDLGTEYMASCSEDPRYPDTWERYKYQSNGSGGGVLDATRYVLWAKTETGLGYWVVCSNGKIGERASPWQAISDGNCPL